MIRAVLACLALALAGAAEAAPATLTIGDLVLYYDDEEWQAIGWPNGALLQAPGCTGIVCKDRMGVVISIASAEGPLPAEIPRSELGYVDPLWELLDHPTPWTGDGAVRNVKGFTIFATDRWSGCRAMSASELTAILDHAGNRYTFASGVAAGCAGIWGVGRDAFVEILAGLRPRD